MEKAGPSDDGPAISFDGREVESEARLVLSPGP